MAKLIQSNSSEGIITERQSASKAKELRRIAEEKARAIEAEYQAKIVSGDYSDESFREYAQKLNDVLRDYGAQLINSHGPV